MELNYGASGCGRRRNANLYIELVSNVQSVYDCRWGRSPIFMQFQSARASLDDLFQRYCPSIITFAGETKVQWQPVCSSKHVSHIELARRTRRRVCSCARSGSPSDHGCGARSESLVDLLRADVVNVDVEGTSGDDELLARNDFGRGTDDERGVDSGHDVRVSRFPYTNNATIFDANICLKNPSANHPAWGRALDGIPCRFLTSQ